MFISTHTADTKVVFPITLFTPDTQWAMCDSILFNLMPLAEWVQWAALAGYGLVEALESSSEELSSIFTADSNNWEKSTASWKPSPKVQNHFCPIALSSCPSPSSVWRDSSCIGFLQLPISSKTQCTSYTLQTDCNTMTGSSLGWWQVSHRAGMTDCLKWSPRRTWLQNRI